MLLADTDLEALLTASKSSSRNIEHSIGARSRKLWSIRVFQDEVIPASFYAAI